MSSRRKRPIQLTWFEGVVVLNLYGNLLFILASLTLAFLSLQPSVLSACAGALGVGAGYWGIAVTRRIPSKLRLSNAILRRVHRQGYDARHFRLTCKDLCTRLMTRYIHLRLGRLGEAQAVIRMHRQAKGILIQPGGPVLSSLIESGQLSEGDLEAAVRLALAGMAPATAQGRATEAARRDDEAQPGRA